MADEPKEQQPPVSPAGEQPAAPKASPAPSASSPSAEKPAATQPPAPGAPTAPGAGAPPKPAAPAAPKAPPIGPTPLDNELVKRYRARFGDAIREALEDRKQAILVVERERLGEIAKYSRDEEKYDFLSDLTAVDWPKREKRFDVVLNLYSFAHNTRLRIKAQAAAGEPVPSVCGVWPTANWLEREAYDMFGIEFAGHPALTRILLPEEWQGHPLRKDYDILTQDEAWVRENLGIESGQ
jgi:NADH-quinone oxidoreductase subunit C